MEKVIASKQHPLVKYLVKLRDVRSFREKEKKVLITGKKMIQDLAKDFSPISIYIEEGKKNILSDAPILMSKEVMKKISNLQAPDGYAALFTKPSPISMEEKKFLLICDEIIDPGNLGTLVRTALGLHWQGVIVTPNTVDLFNDKALRASKGAIFHLPFAYMEKSEIIALKDKLPLYIADMKGSEINSLTPSPCMVVLSSEKGVDPLLAKNATKITLPMHKSIDSFNVAIAGSIILYLLRPRC